MLMVKSLVKNLNVVRRIVKNTFIPVSADKEAGYAVSTEGAVDTTCAVLDIGAVELNLEVSTGNANSTLRSISSTRKKSKQ